MPRKRGRKRLRRCAKSVFSEVPLYSSPVRSLCTEKLMSLSFAITPSSPKSRTKFG